MPTQTCAGIYYTIDRPCDAIGNGGLLFLCCESGVLLRQFSRLLHRDPQPAEGFGRMWQYWEPFSHCGRRSACSRLDRIEGWRKDTS